jgi:ribosomal protein L37E
MASTVTVVCRGCGWASYAVTRAWAEEQITRFNAYYESADEATRSSFGGPSSPSDYRCLRCDGTAFRPALPEDRIPNYVTLSPVICDELAEDPEIPWERR